jgi:catechol 2,3-dioxygenase-like lactoylglutathione lyase family enzyme
VIAEAGTGGQRSAVSWWRLLSQTIKEYYKGMKSSKMAPVMMAEPERQAQPGPASAVSAKVASSLMAVSDLARSVNFYCDVFSCRVALHEQDTALLLTPGGFQIYLHSKGPSRRPRVGATGVQYLMWATDSQPELLRISQRLFAYDVATCSYTENGVTFVEGCDPDGGRVIVAYPSPSQLPREVIAPRLRGRLRSLRRRLRTGVLAA